MSETPIQRFLSAYQSTMGQAPIPRGKGWQACCPAHDDHRPSLSIDEGDDGRALVNCHRGCETKEVCAALGLTLADLMPSNNPNPKPRNGKERTQNPQNSHVGAVSRNCEDIEYRNRQSKNQNRIVAAYDYRNEHGKFVFQVCRFEPKTFRQRTRNAQGKFVWTVKGVRQVPYRLPELLAKPTEPVLVVEGEKDADGLAKLGFLATCNAGGAGKWQAEFAEYLNGRKVVILPDNDDPGRQHADSVARSLSGKAAAIKVVSLPGLPQKGDVSDWLDAGGTGEQLREIIKATPEWTPTEPEPAQWPDLDPLEIPLPDFPMDALPEPLGQWVRAESHATQTPADLAGLLSLAVCSAAISKRVEVQARPGWLEPVNLFVAILQEPGTRKSAVFAAAVKPLKEIEAERIEAARPDVAILQSQRRQKETQLKKLEKEAANDAHAAHEAEGLATELGTTPEPVLPRLILDDATSEKLGMMLADHGGKIASLSPEGGVFDLMAGLYSKSGIPQFGVYLMGHSGDDLVTDRVTRKSVCVERPALTCGYAIQPQVIEGIAENTAFRGRGLLARFLYAAPRTTVGHREIAPQPVSEATKEAYHNLIRTLADVEGETVLTLSPDAQARLMDWEADIENMLADGGDLESMKDWGGKLAGATLRLAATIHCVKHRSPIGQIDGDTLTAAIKLGKYLIPHAEHVLNLMEASEESGDDDARYILKWILQHQMREFTKRDAHQHGRKRFSKADDIEPGLAVLAQRGYIRLAPIDPETLNKPGRPPSPNYEVNPAVLKNGNTEIGTQNTHNSASEPSGGICEYSEYQTQGIENPNRERFTI